MSTPKTLKTDFNIILSLRRGIVNARLRQLLAEQHGIENDLKQALAYTLEAPAKRIRAAMVLFCCELLSGEINENAEIAAAAIEMVHTYSLIHDDLPAMDNDELRRGKPTCHIAFDEATAILAGDALLTLAFEVLAERTSGPNIAIILITELAKAAGAAGMIAGQISDLKAENTSPTKELIEYIHTNKTARMFRCAAAFGAICGRADETQFNNLCEYGLKIGLGFQITDDILDISGSTKQLGKTTGKDIKAAKATYPSILGLDKSREMAKQLAGEAVQLLQPFGQKADNLRNLAFALLERTK
ncbi:polyprenyl synthetase family protein [Planctomycetota bacterium]